MSETRKNPQCVCGHEKRHHGMLFSVCLLCECERFAEAKEHWPDCWRSEGHHDCAKRYVSDLIAAAIETGEKHNATLRLIRERFGAITADDVDLLSHLCLPDAHWDIAEDVARLRARLADIVAAFENDPRSETSRGITLQHVMHLRRLAARTTLANEAHWMHDLADRLESLLPAPVAP